MKTFLTLAGVGSVAGMSLAFLINLWRIEHVDGGGGTDCPACGLACASPFGPVIRDWLNNHNCAGAA